MEGECNKADLKEKNEGNEEEENNEGKGWSRFSITIEPVMFCVSFLNQFTSGITIDLLERNVCHQKFNLSYIECESVFSTGIKSQIQAETADINMFNNLIQAICPVVLVLCVGPWSDINGRKPFLLWGLTGYVAFYFLWGLFSLFPSIPVMCFIIPAIPLSLSGGWVSVLVACQSYMADIWRGPQLPFRISVTIFCTVGGSLLGNAVTTPIFDVLGSAAYETMYFSSSAVALLAYLYATYVLKETIINEGKRTRLLDIAHIKSILTVLVINPTKGRLITLLTMSIITTEITSAVGEANLIYLIGKSSFNWTLGDYNMFNSVNTVLGAITPITGIWLLKKKMKLHSYTVISMCSVCMFVFNMLKSFSITERMFWTVALLSRFVCIIGPCIDSELSLLVSKKDLGKAYAFSSLLDALSPLVALPLFNQLFKMMLPDNTLKMYLLASVFSAFTVLSSITLLLIRHFSNKKTFSLQNKENGIELKIPI